MKKIFIFSYACMAMALFPLQAEKVDADKAGKLAQRYVQTKRKLPAGEHVRLKYTATQRQRNLQQTSARDTIYYYVFNIEENAGGGFIIVSGDDVAAPVLGYSEKGSYDENNLPPNFAYWMDYMQREIRWAITQNEPQSETMRQQWDEYLNGNLTVVVKSVAPLLSTTWNQNPSPYWDQCPTTSTGDRCLVGCVATATAQIMKYYNHPARGSGQSEAYISYQDGISINIPSVSFEVNYDWGNMRNSYTGGGYTQQQASAVATILSHVGRAVKMKYSPTGSGAPSKNVPDALINYFGYDKSCQIKYRVDYNDNSWDQLLKSQIDAGMPVYYAGFGPGVGHAFVCDGYRDDGTFHFNWGWSGSYDGYFRTTALTPGTRNYNSGQEIVINIKPREEEMCNAIAVFPYHEGFENNGTDFPSCWNQEHVTGNTVWYVARSTTGTPNTAHGGSYKARMYGTQTGHKTKLIMPPINLNGVKNPKLQFWHTQRIWATGQDKLRIFYKTSKNGAWTLLQEYLSDVPGWTERTISLPDGTADYYIAFEGETNYGWGIMLDDISITEGVSGNMTTVTLTAGNVWGDGTGFQMLLDATATQFGKAFPATGLIWTDCNAPATLYDVFSHKIPENANPVCTTNHIVVNNSVTIRIPAGIYDYCIVNPAPDWGIWFAVGDYGRKDNFLFEAGKHYKFTVVWTGSNAEVVITIDDDEPETFDPPKNVTASVDGNNVAVTWEAQLPDINKWLRHSVNDVVAGGHFATSAGNNHNTAELATVQPTGDFELLQRRALSGLTNNSNVKMLENSSVPTGYAVYRLKEGQPETAWTLLSDQVEGMNYTDKGWTALPSGDYQYAVKARYAGNHLSAAALSNVLNKICDPVTSFPYQEGFENNGVNLPECWRQEIVAGTSEWQVVPANTGTPRTAHGGSYKALYYNDSFTTHTARFVMPPLNLSGLKHPVLNFWHTQEAWDDDQDRLSIYYKTSSDGTWTLLREYQSDVPVWTERTIPLPNSSADYYIAFVGEAHYGYGVHLDDISISDNMATVTLAAGYVWNDGSGYQMLLDATATQFGQTIPASGNLWTNCNPPATLYDVFSHKIPENANPACTTSRIVINSSITIQIPPGMYDYCIVNPTPGDKLYIAGGVNGRKDNYLFEAGKHYTFTAVRSGENDEIMITIEGGEPETFDPPQNVKATVVDNHVAVSWDAPGEPLPDMNKWMRHSVNDVITGRFGWSENEGADMTVAMRFTPADLTAMGVVSGHTITKIGLGIGTQMSSVTSMEIRIWEGGNSVANQGSLVRTIPVTGYTSFAQNTMREIELSAPYMIDATKELRIGWRLVNTAGYPFGRDAGPAVPEKGTLVQCPQINSGNWLCTYSNLTPQPEWNWNFSLKAWVTNGRESVLPASEIQMSGSDNIFAVSELKNHKATEYAIGQQGGDDEILHRKSMPDYLESLSVIMPESAIPPSGYEVYRLTAGQPETGWTLLSNQVAYTRFTDEGWPALPSGKYQYAVKAKYTGNNLSEAALSNVLTKLNHYEITFNNPANGTMSVMAGGNQLTSGSMVDQGTVLTITATPNNQYQLEILTVNGVSFTSGDKHTVTAATNIVCSFIPVKSDDSSLASVLVNEKPATPKPGDATTWQITIDHTTSIIIIATAGHHAAKVEESHQGSRQVQTGKNDFVIAVIAENGNRVNYCLEVTVKEKLTNIDEQIEQPLVAYPNPAHDYIIISGLKGNGILTMLDASGRQLIRRNIASTEEIIFVNEVPPGNCIVQVVEGENMRTIKVVVE